MCATILLKKDGKVIDELETPADVERLLGVDTSKHLDWAYRKLNKNACLCQLNMDAVLAGLDYEFRGFHYVVST